MDKIRAVDRICRFVWKEATIDDCMLRSRRGEPPACRIVQHYIDRVRAYNGVSSALVTADGASIPQAAGTVRGQAPLRFPTETVKAATILPDLEKYQGPPLEFGRMEPTASDANVQQQFGMIVGIPNAGQVNALGTLNIRGERSVTCRGSFDRPISEGPLPPDAPAVCEVFRRYPDAFEQAAELDARYGRNPDLDEMPMYGVVFSFKDPFDTKDMRSTGAATQLRHRFPGGEQVWRAVAQKRAQSFPKASTPNTRTRRRSGRAPKRRRCASAGVSAHLGGNIQALRYAACRILGSGPDRAVGEREPGMASIVRERGTVSRASNHNALRSSCTQVLLGFEAAQSVRYLCDRAGILCARSPTAPRFLGRAEDGKRYYVPRDLYTNVRFAVLSTPYAATKNAGTQGALNGIRMRHSRLQGISRAESRRAARPLRRRDQTMIAGKWGHTGESAGSDVDARSDLEQIDDRLSPRGLANTVFEARYSVPLGKGRTALFRRWPARFADSVFAEKVFAQPCRPSTIWVELAEGELRRPRHSTLRPQAMACRGLQVPHPQYLTRRAAIGSSAASNKTLTISLRECALQFLGTSARASGMGRR